jgi:hypothetical protein
MLNATVIFPPVPVPVLVPVLPVAAVAADEEEALLLQAASKPMEAHVSAARARRAPFALMDGR